MKRLHGTILLWLSGKQCFTLKGKKKYWNFNKRFRNLRMGQLLSHPIEEKFIDEHQRNAFTYCVGLMQGYRMSMEDAFSVSVGNGEQVSVFGVFDGHGGRGCAEYISEHMTKFVYEELEKLIFSPERGLTDYMNVVRDSFFKMDHDIPAQISANSGSTAILATIIAKRYVIIANTGDSRCIMSLDGEPKAMSFDHKTTTMGERLRIENSGGYIVNGRVNEVLALSRAVGDSRFKSQFIRTTRNNASYVTKKKAETNKNAIRIPPEIFQVTVEPDILVYDLLALQEPEFIVLACDGVWECYTSSQIVDRVREKISQNWKLETIVEYILDDCISMANKITGIGFDNMTLIIIAVHSDSDINSWYKMMKERIATKQGRKTSS